MCSLKEEHVGREHSKCKGPEVAWLLCPQTFWLDQRQREEGDWGGEESRHQAHRTLEAVAVPWVSFSAKGNCWRILNKGARGYDLLSLAAVWRTGCQGQGWKHKGHLGNHFGHPGKRR